MDRKCSMREASGIRNLNGRRRMWGTRVRMVRDGYAAEKRERWRAEAQGAGMGDGGNAYSREIRYLENGEGTPFLMRGEAAEILDEDGVRAVEERRVEGGAGMVVETERREVGEPRVARSKYGLKVEEPKLSALGEWLTTLGRQIDGKPFYVEIRGQKNITESWTVESPKSGRRFY